MVPASQEAEAGGSLEPGKSEVAVSRNCATALQHGNRARLHLKKEKKRKKNKLYTLIEIKLNALFKYTLNIFKIDHISSHKI